MTTRTSVKFYFMAARWVLAPATIIFEISLVLAIDLAAPQYAVIGGSLLTIAGIPLAFLRLLRGDSDAESDGERPRLLPLESEANSVQFSIVPMKPSFHRIAENLGVITGVVLLVAGALLAGVVAPILAMTFAS